MTNCDPSDKKLSSCVEEYLDAKYGPNCSYAGLRSSSPAAGCSAGDLLSRWREQFSLKFEGTEYVRARTNCSLPCRRFAFPVRKVMAAAAADVSFIGAAEGDTDLGVAVLRTFLGNKIVRFGHLQNFLGF